MERIDASLPTPTPLPATSTSTSSSSLPRPLAHVILLLIDGVGDVPCKAFAVKDQGHGGGGSSSNNNASKSSSSSFGGGGSLLLTPLQAAAPLDALDAVASRGLLGLLDPVQPGKACGSDTAHLSLLGYDPRTYYRGRGAFESLGAGLSMDPGDIAFKCNFATLEEEGEDGDEEKGTSSPTPLVVSRRADRAFDEAGPVLCEALDGLELPSFPGVEVRVKYATEHRAGVVLSTTRKKKTKNGDFRSKSSTSTSSKTPFELSDAVSGTDPLKDNLPLRRCVSLLLPPSEEEEEEQEGDEEQEEEQDEGEAGEEEERKRKRKSEREEELRNARVTAEVVNELSDEIRKVLRSHPLNLQRRAEGRAVANALLLRGCGSRAPLPDFAARFGFSGGALAVAPTKIIAGLATCAGFEVLECEGATGDYRTSLRAKVDAAVAAVVRRRSGFAAGGEGGGEGAEKPVFVLLHVKAVDDAGHDRAPFKKMAWLRAVDAALARLALKLAGREGEGREGEEEEGRGSSSAAAAAGVVVAVTGDHSTPVEFGDHSCEPVPFAAAPLPAVAAELMERRKERRRKKNEAENGASEDEEGEIVAPSEEEMRRVAAEAAAKKEGGPAISPSSSRFDEVSASLGSLGRFPGAEVMPLLVRLSAAWGGGGGGGRENK